MFVNIDCLRMSIDVHRFSWMFVDVQYLFLRLFEEKTLGGVHLKKGTCQCLLFLLFFRIDGLVSTHYGLWPSLCTALGWYYLRYRPRLVLVRHGCADRQLVLYVHGTRPLDRNWSSQFKAPTAARLIHTCIQMPLSRR